MAYRVAVIGCGGRGREHAIALEKDERVELVALADPKTEAAEALRAELELEAAVFGDHRDLLASAKPDAVALCLWTPLHLPVLRECVEAGVRLVLSEKPMAPTLGESRKMVELAKSAGVQLTFCHQRRFAEGNQRARRWLSEGLFGQVERMDLFSVMNLLDCGTHSIDQALSFAGESPGVWAMGGWDTSEFKQWFGLPFERMFAGFFRLESGVQCTIRCGTPEQVLWGGVRVTGSEGFFEVFWDGELHRAVRYADPGWAPEPLPEANHDLTMDRAMRDSFDAWEQGREPELSADKALRAAEIIFGLYESVRRHQAVELPVAELEDNPYLSMLEAGAFGK